VLYNDEILICGALQYNKCYSYHILTNQYKFICSFPEDVILKGHCVIKCHTNNHVNSHHDPDLTLLSFGSDYRGKNKHTLVMKYKSVWNNNYDKDDNKNENKNTMKSEEQISSSPSSSSSSPTFNEWIPLIHPIHHSPIILGREQDNFYGVRAVIGGINHQLLFITCCKDMDNNMSVFNLNACEYVTHVTFRIHSDNVRYHALVNVSNSNKNENKNVNENNNKNKNNNNNNNEMVLLCYGNDGVHIQFNEWNATFGFQIFSLPICLSPFIFYSYVCVNDVIYLFGGWYCDHGHKSSKNVYAYKVKENKWLECTDTLPYPLENSVAVLNQDSTCVHIFGGWNGETDKKEEKQIKWSLLKAEWKEWNEERKKEKYKKKIKRKRKRKKAK